MDALDLLGRIPRPHSKIVVANLGAGKSESSISSQLVTARFGELINVEIFRPYVEQLKRLAWASAHTSIIEQDLRDWLSARPTDSVDVVLLIDVLEHFTPVHAVEVLDRCLLVARKRILIWIPIGACKQGQYDGNPFQTHQSTWLAEDFESYHADVELFPGFHKHFSPPVSAAWVAI